MLDRVKTGIPGFDELLGEGIERGNVVLVAGGAGTGKTNFGCHFLYNGMILGEKGLYISFEEDVEQIKKHVVRFGMDFRRFENQGKAKFVKVDVFYISRAIEAIFERSRGELEVNEGLPELLPQDFKPDRIVIDSLSALAAVMKEEEYRYFLFMLFSEFKKIGATVIALAETKQEPTEYSRTGVEEFLGDGVIVLYNIKRGDVRTRAVEILKLRGSAHEQKIVPFKITERGIVVYPKQEVFTS